MPNIVLEGFDGSGKSYLSKALSGELGMPIVWPGGPPKDVSDMLLRLHHQLETTNTIFDRVTSVSEACYREDLDMTTSQLLKRCRTIMSHRGDIFVYCTNIVGEDESGFQDEGHQCMVIRRTGEITHKYSRLFKNFPHLKWKAKIDNVNGILDSIKRLL